MKNSLHNYDIHILRLYKVIFKVWKMAIKKWLPCILNHTCAIISALLVSGASMWMFLFDLETLMWCGESVTGDSINVESLWSWCSEFQASRIDCRYSYEVWLFDIHIYMQHSTKFSLFRISKQWNPQTRL